MTKNLAWKVAGLSAMAGMRSMSGPALLSLNDKALAHSEFGKKIFGSDNVKLAVQALAVAELIFDKLPFAPKRIAIFPLVGRTISGVLIGASLYSAAKESPAKGAIVGGASALASTVLSYQVRRVLTKYARIPDMIVALAEDAFVLTRGIKMLRSTISSLH